MNPNSALCPQETQPGLWEMGEQGLSRAEVPIIENKEDAREWKVEGRLWAEGQFELFSLKKPVDCLPVTGAGATEIDGLSRG